MSEEPFVMISLKDNKAKKLANALTNKSADKILKYLANKKDATEAQIAKALKLPVSTVNYTMKVLVDAKLVVADEYSYSEKGREVNHYKLAKKYIIIAPDEETETFLDKLKKYVPAFAITIGAGGLLRLYQAFTSTTTTEAAPMAMRAMPEADMAAEAFIEPTTPMTLTSPDWFLYFLLGAITIFVLILALEYWRNR